jgi:hypothetical protein
MAAHELVVPKSIPIIFDIRPILLSFQVRKHTPRQGEVVFIFKADHALPPALRQDAPRKNPKNFIFAAAGGGLEL